MSESWLILFIFSVISILTFKTQYVCKVPSQLSEEEQVFSKLSVVSFRSAGKSLKLPEDLENKNVWLQEIYLASGKGEMLYGICIN